jgi:hypothetical protein
MEDRLIGFSIRIVNLGCKLQAVSELAPSCHHILRSGLSSAMYYGDAVNLSSLPDLMKKLHSVLAELRKIQLWLELFGSDFQLPFQQEIEGLREENAELIALILKETGSVRKKLKPEMAGKGQ